MIQKVNPHNSGNPPVPEIWGSWGPPSPYGRKYYSLEVVQNPIRARMCGFGDKDRRPLAPAAVAKMHVQREDHSVVDVDEVDCSFFLVTVDLWSADGNKEMNLVLHPTSSDRYVPNGANNKKRRNTAASNAATTSTQASSQPTESQSPVPPTPSTSQYPPTSGTGMTPYMTPTTPGYQHAYPFPPQHGTVQDTSGSYTPVAPYGSQPSTDPSGWGYSTSPSMDRPAQPFGPPALPSIQTMARAESQASAAAASADVSYDATSPTHAADSWHVTSGSRDETDAYRSWPEEQSSYSALEGNPPDAIDPALRDPSVQAPAGHSQAWSTSPIDPYSNARYHVVPVPGPVPSQGSPGQPVVQQQQHQPQSVDTGLYASASYAQQQHQQQQQQAQAQASYPHTPGFTQNPTPPSTIPPLPRHTYTRTLVGPLSANACRLLDEHRKPGIFFLFQDLSIRTEGTFRLRLRLMNVGAPPAPEPGGYRVHTDVSPVLAQTFTDPFVVYSAKRFPGVPDTTALSIALGNQGQKLPLRNRNNTTKSRKRARNGSDESGEDSDDDS